MGGSNQRTGARGEAKAAAWYEARGGVVVARNWRCRDGEIDLVVRCDRTLVFCEVKTRRSDAFGLPAEAVTATKRARIRHLAARWLDESGVRPQAVRFDVASVLAGRVEIIQDAF